ncbi:MAG: hypothetical protein PF689_06005 [Deltaproteobacteria bacterium]|jgi:hypothetical protein|nr:hypothetical protein [Deltaproteobacteria bacterium]
MPKVNKKRSLEYLRNQLLFLNTTLELKEKTADFTKDITSLLSKIDFHLHQKKKFNDRNIFTAAVLYSSKTDLDILLSSLWYQARTADKLNGDTQYQQELFPDGVSGLTRKTGKGISDVETKLENLALKLENINDDNLYHLIPQIKNSIKQVKTRLANNQKSNCQMEELKKREDELKKEMDQLYLDIEMKLTAIYKRNRKIISAFFMK